MSMFETNPVHLSDLIRNIDGGAIQLPEFQRDWIWDDRNIRELLESVLARFPIGAIMMLKSGGRVEFAPRPIAGSNVDQGKVPDQFVLDGQQRLTSLFQLLQPDRPVSAKIGRFAVNRYYFVDMRAALGQSDGPVVVSLPETKIRNATSGGPEALDLSVPEHEYARHMIPTGALLKPNKWSREYLKYWSSRSGVHDALATWDRFDEDVRGPLSQYQLPVITLSETVSREAVCAVFEKVNDRGVHLTVFELLTATLAAKGFNLRQNWAAQRKRLRKHKVLRSITGDHYLQAVAMLSNSDSGCDKADILGIERKAYEDCHERATNGFIKAAEFLNELRIFRDSDLPYVHQVVTLAILFGKDPIALSSADARCRLATWYWCGVFGGDYSRSVNSRIVEDAQQVLGYVGGVGRSARVDFATFDPTRLPEIRTRSNAAYRGINALLLLKRCRDWYTDREMDFAIYEDEQVDIHHIFPRAWCRDGTKNKLGKEIPNGISNSIINKAPLTAKTNRAIGGRAPSEYLVRLREGNKNLDQRLPKFLVDISALERDDFIEFFINRGNAILNMIYKAMGKPAPEDARQVFRDALTNAGLMP